LWHGVAEALYRIRRSERLSGQTDVMMTQGSGGQAGGRGGVAHAELSAARDRAEHGARARSWPWRTHDDYLGALDAKYRRKFKDLSKKTRAAGCVVESLAEITAHEQRLHEPISRCRATPR